MNSTRHQQTPKHSTLGLILSLILVSQIMAFAPNSISRTSISYSCSSSSTSNRSRSRTAINAVADPPMSPAEHQDDKQKNNNDNEDNESDWTPTLGGYLPNFKNPKRARNKSNTKPEIILVDNIQDYKNVVVDESNQMVVVRFFASWCRSCKASQPLFFKLVNKYSSNVKFVQVPLTKETAYLQEGLGVPSVPFVHIYHPDGGLVEEMKLSKPHFQEFEDKLESYLVGSCNLPLEDDDNEELSDSRRPHDLENQNEVGDFQ